MKLIDMLFCTATAALLCAATHPARAAGPQPADAPRPVLVAQADAALRASHADVPVLAQGPGERGARVAAAKSPQALRQYIFRTRMIYGLQYSDFARE